MNYWLLQTYYLFFLFFFCPHDSIHFDCAVRFMLRIIIRWVLIYFLYSFLFRSDLAFMSFFFSIHSLSFSPHILSFALFCNHMPFRCQFISPFFFSLLLFHTSTHISHLDNLRNFLYVFYFLCDNIRRSVSFVFDVVCFCFQAERPR